MIGIYSNCMGYPFTGKVTSSMVKMCWMEYKNFKAERPWQYKVNVVKWYKTYVKKNATWSGHTRVGNYLVKEIEII